MSSPAPDPPGTPSRANGHNATSSPVQPGFGPDDQLRSEASQASLRAASQETPRANRLSQDTSQNPPTSSPLFYQSSPANGSLSRSATNGFGVSSPLRQQTAASSDGNRTPRASGQTNGGERVSPMQNFAMLIEPGRVFSYPLHVKLKRWSTTEWQSYRRPQK